MAGRTNVVVPTMARDCTSTETFCKSKQLPQQTRQIQRRFMFLHTPVKYYCYRFLYQVVEMQMCYGYCWDLKNGRNACRISYGFIIGVRLHPDTTTPTDSGNSAQHPYPFDANDPTDRKHPFWLKAVKQSLWGCVPGHCTRHAARTNAASLQQATCSRRGTPSQSLCLSSVGSTHLLDRGLSRSCFRYTARASSREKP